MTTSPYDTLPTGKKEKAADNAQYIDVPYDEVTPEAQETSRDENASQQPSEPLHYVDVDIEADTDPAPTYATADAPDSASAHTAAPAVAHNPAHVPAKTAKPAPPSPAAFTKTEPFEKAPRYTAASVKNMWGVREYILPFEESLLVPDTMPDMERLLFAEGNVRLSRPGNQRYGKDDFLAGDITVYAVYQPAAPSNSPVDVVKSVVPFKTDKCWNNAEGDSFRAEASIKSITAEMVNERKFIAKGELCIRITDIAHKDLNVFEGTDDNALILAEDSIQVADLDFETLESTEISQDINIKENQPSPVKILKTTMWITENHRQITSGKLVINASIHSRVLYVGEEDGAHQLCCLTNKTDFSMFVLVKDNAASDLINISFLHDDLEIVIENKDRFQLKGKVSALILGYRHRTVKRVSDAYHKLRDITFDVASQELSSVKDVVSGEISAREVVVLAESDEKPERLLCGCAQPPSLESRAEKGRIIIEGSMPVTILALNEEEKPFIIEAALPLRGSFETNASGSDLTPCISAALKDFWFDEINSRQLEINARISINAWIIGRERFSALENMCFAESDTPQRRVSMAVYVAGSGETLWDVAKRYKSDVAAIARLNQIDPQKPLSEGTKLFVTR